MDCSHSQFFLGFIIQDWGNMKNLLKTTFLFLSIIIGFSCSEKKIEEEQVPQIKSTPVELTCFANQVIKKNEHFLIVYDEVKFEKSKKIEISIQNEKIELIEKQISDSAKIVMQTLNYDEFGNHKFNEQISLEKFQSIFANPEFERYKHIPFKITTIGDQAISIEEIYIP